MPATTTSTTHNPTSRPDCASAAGPLRPPQWALETLVATLGKLPAYLGRQLDVLARVTFIGPIVRLFSSLWLGILWIFLLGVYIGLGSGLPQIRAYFEMTDLEFFDAWPMGVLLTLLCTSLIVVTLRRIPLTLSKLGVWTVHLGILTLIAGCTWYFTQKTEGTVRIFLGQTANSYFDATERALYVYNVNPDGTLSPQKTMTPLPRLPIYREYLPERGTGLNRELPADTLGKLGPALRDVKLRIVGYLPFAVLTPVGFRAAQPQEDPRTGSGPAIAFQLLRDDHGSGSEWLIASSPAGRVAESDQFPFSIEYLYHPTPQRVRDVTASFSGPQGLTVRIPRLNIERTLAAEKGRPIPIEGSAYTLLPDEVLTMPMLSAGYERARSSALTIHITRKNADGTALQFDRMAVYRYPERSPDFIEQNGQRIRKQDGVDPDIQVVFHDAAQAEFRVLEDEAGKLTFVARAPGGATTTRPISPNENVDLGLKGFAGLQFRIVAHTANAVSEMAPRFLDPRQRPRSLTAMEVIRLSMLQLAIENEGFKKPDIYVPFAEYANTSAPPVGKPPTIVEIPGLGRIALVFSTTQRELPSDLQLTAFDPVKYQGAMQTYADYISTLRVTDHATSQAHTMQARLNSPAEDHGLYYFQAGWDGQDDPPTAARFSVLGVGNRPGIKVMVLGALMIILGTAYAFYIKPILLNLKKQQLAAWAAALGRAGP
jgi:hypothetical protein